MSIKKNPILSVIIRVRVPGFQQGRHSNQRLLFIMQKMDQMLKNILKIPLDLNSERFSVIILGSVMCEGSLAVLWFPEEGLRETLCRTLAKFCIPARIHAHAVKTSRLEDQTGIMSTVQAKLSKLMQQPSLESVSAFCPERL